MIKGKNQSTNIKKSVKKYDKSAEKTKNNQIKP